MRMDCSRQLPNDSQQAEQKNDDQGTVDHGVGNPGALVKVFLSKLGVADKAQVAGCWPCKILFHLHLPEKSTGPAGVGLGLYRLS